jgi:hypothetical protein
MNDIRERSLDYLAAKHDQNVTADENLINKALGVLQENGVYACFLYLLANEGKSLVEETLNLFKEPTFGFDVPPKNEKNVEILEYVADHITASLPRLLLAKEALEQMLIYARYGAKAKDQA